MLKVSEGIWSVCATTYEYRKRATFWTLDRSFFRIGREQSSPQICSSPNHYWEETINNLRSLFTKSTPQIVCTPNYFCGNTITNLRGTFRLWTHQPRDPQVILMWSQVRPKCFLGLCLYGGRGRGRFKQTHAGERREGKGAGESLHITLTPDRPPLSALTGII